MGTDPADPTPSQLARIEACIVSETLEHTGSSSEPAFRGSVAHRFLANVLEQGRDPALEREHPRDRSWLSELPVERLPAFHPQLYAAEVAFAWNPTTGAGRELGRNLSREEARALKRPGEMVGIADVCGVTESTVVIHDYKTGRGYVDPAEVNWQIRTYAVMAAAAYGKSGAKVFIQRALDDGSCWYDFAVMDEFDLDAHAGAVRKLLRRRQQVLEDAKAGRPLPAFNVGQHCTYCPAAWGCKPQVEALLALARQSPDEGGISGFDQQLGALMQQDLAKAWEWLKVIAFRVEAYQGVMKNLARQQPFPLAGGRQLGERDVTFETIVATRAKAAFVATYGEQIGGLLYSESVVRKEEITKKALRDSLRRFVLPTLPRKEAKIGKVVEAAEAALVKGGAMSSKSIRKVDEHKPPKAGAAEPEVELEVEPPPEQPAAEGAAA